MIEIKGVNKTYRSKKSADTNALRNINLTFENKGLVFIVGKSGSGKSTLLNLLGGLDTPDKGKILIDHKDLCKMSNQELDSYRNSYVGFVFQEFNLLEEFNVFENINLSLKLQGINDDKLILDTLKNLDIDGLEKRNTNELSGGQKQRVAIARTLVKKPKLILADEPTGNLDRKSSDQIFRILKKISKEELVIVVSHDIESAFVYADRIIKIEDGEIIEDSKKNVKRDKMERSKYEKSTLPFGYIYKMASSYLMNKPGRLVLTILLSMLAFSFMCFCINIYLFDDVSLIKNTINDNNFNTLRIDHREVKFNKYGNREETALDFKKGDIALVEASTSSKVNKEYALYENNNSLNFEFGPISTELLENDAYSVKPSNFKFIELSDKRIIKLYNGEYPSNNDEIVVHKYFADSIINFGIYDINDNLYKPNNYEEIVNDKTQIKLGTHKVIISGIVNDDNSLYERAFKMGEFWSNDLKNFYIENYSSKSSYIYVNDTFIDDLVLGNKLDLSRLTLKYNNISNEDSIELLNSSVKYYDLNGNLKEKSSISENEIILSIDTFRLYSDFNKDFDKYLKNNKNLVYDKIVEKYLIKYLKENKLNDINIKLINRTFNNSSDVHVIGVSLKDKNYISSTYNDYFDSSKKIVTSVYVYEDDKDKIEYIFNDLDYLYDKEYYDEGEKYYISFNNSNRVYSVIFIYHMAKRYLFTFSVVFVLFSILLILNYISASITTYKKEIGILRSIGTSSGGVTKIFVIETLLIGLIAWVFGILMWIVESYELNNSFFGNMFFKLRGIVINPSTVIISLAFIVIASLLITCLLMEKINKVKPIDVVLNRD